MNPYLCPIIFSYSSNYIPNFISLLYPGIDPWSISNRLSYLFIFVFSRSLSSCLSVNVFSFESFIQLFIRQYLFICVPVIYLNIRSVSRLLRLVAACYMIAPVLLSKRESNCGFITFIFPPPGAVTAGCRAGSAASAGPVAARAPAPPSLPALPPGDGGSGRGGGGSRDRVMRWEEGY